MRITWFSNAPWAPTGYGTQTAQVCRRLRDDGHDVAIATNYGQMAQITEWEGIPVYPGGAERFSTDILDHVHRDHLDGKPGLLLTLYDVWVLGEAGKGHDVASWTPVDHEPVPPQVLAWARDHRTIAMSRHGQGAFRHAGVEATYIPHGIDTALFKPTPSDVRKRLKVPDDAFLVMINAANQDSRPSRKAWPEMLLALTRWMATRKDVYVYLHADLTRPSGLHLPGLMDMLSMPSDRMRACDQASYRIGAYTQEELVELYSAADVLLSTSRGEGFGLAVPEAMACGTPAIVSDFTAQPEIVGDTGWKVRWAPYYDPDHGAFWATPYIGGIVDALEAAYQERGTALQPVRREAARLKAMEYDADTVYAQHWKPFLAAVERDIDRPARKGMSKAAKRRKAA